MSKKETVVVCFLMNAVLMVILFIGAIKHPEEKRVKDETHIILEETNDDNKQSSLDSIDRLLDEYVMKKESEKNQELEVAVEAKTEVEPKKQEMQECQAKTEELKEPEPKQQIIMSEKMYEIKVVSGDSLDKLAKRHNTSVQEIMKLNNLNSSTLQIGQILYVKQLSKMKKDQEQKRYYVVKSGDSPWTIAAKNNLKLNELLKLNQLNESSAKKLKPGDRLRIQ